MKRPYFLVERPVSSDPLSDVVALLQPTARFSKRVEAAGEWCVRREGEGEPFYMAVLHGQCRLSVEGGAPITLQAGDFVLVPALRELVNTSMQAPANITPSLPVRIAEGHFRVGSLDGPVALCAQIGHCGFASPDAALLVSLLPRLLHVRGEPRLATLVQMVGEEARAQRPARDVVLERLLEVLLIEALRSGMDSVGGSGLVRGLGDERLAAALRALHARPQHAWTVEALAGQATMSRSGFAARFMQVVGVAPMEYLLHWRMALAKRLLNDRSLSLEQVAERVGYASAVTFGAAFARLVGMPPARFARMRG